MRKQVILVVLLTMISSIFWAQNVLDCIPVVKTVNDQINQVVVSSTNGSAIIAWQDERTPGNNDIYAQRVSQDGHMQWPQHSTGKLIISQADNQVNLSMVSDGAGGAIIAWQDDRNVNLDIYATRIDVNGDIYPGWGGADGRLICNDPSDQSVPKLVSVGIDGAFVVWSDARAISGGDYDIYAMRIQLNGALTGDANGTRLQLSADPLNQVNPDICIDGAGGAIIAYEQYSIPTDYDIFAQRINSDCSNLWVGTGVPACIANNNQKNPKLTNDAVGSAIIVWEDNVNFTWDIYAQRVSSNTIQWTANGITVMAIALDQINPVIVSAGLYEAIIVWEHYLSGTDSNIYAQKVWGGAGGTVGSVQWLATGVPVSTTNDSYQLNPMAVSDGADGVIVVYESGENILENGYDVYANHINAAGAPFVVGGYPVCTWDADQTNPMIAYSATATNNAIYAWLDHRNEAAPAIHDIYTLGVQETYTYTVASHDVTGLVAGDLSAEIYFNGVPFATPIYTGYIFGAPGNEPMLAGTYTVVHPTFGSWTPASFTIVDIEQNYSTDFLGIRYILNVTSSTTGQNIYLDTTNLGLPTDHSFYNKVVNVLVGNYTLEPAPFGFVWSPTNIDVVETDFNAGNDYTYTISFTLIPDGTLPVELSSFTATLTAQKFVSLTWVSQSETGLLGYRMYRNDTPNPATAVSITPVLIPASNTSTAHSYNLVDSEVSIGNTYYYWLESVDISSTTFHGPISAVVEGEVPSVLPQYTSMGNAYPNPFRFNSSTTINVSVKAGENGRVSIYNILGQTIRTFEVNQGLNPLIWDGYDKNGNSCSSGIYFYKLQTPSMNQTKKMVILK